VLTVGASNHQRTTTRSDDTLATFTSRGPTSIDRAMKPDVVAPGVGIESVAAAGSTIYNLNPEARIAGTIDTATPPYLSMTGTSMAAPVVAGTIALMLQANPDLTPNLVKAILQYTAERRPRIEVTAQGAGFLNAHGAVLLAEALREDATGAGRDDFAPWSRQIIWGNQRVRGGVLARRANAWRGDVIWGSAATADGKPIVWGTTADGEAPWSSGGDVEPIALEPVDVAFWIPGTDGDDSSWSGRPRSLPTPLRAATLAMLPDERRRTRRDDAVKAGF
jgi:subtilisin family serine protease